MTLIPAPVQHFQALPTTWFILKSDLINIFVETGLLDKASALQLMEQEGDWKEEVTVDSDEPPKPPLLSPVKTEDSSNSNNNNNNDVFAQVKVQLLEAVARATVCVIAFLVKIEKLNERAYEAWKRTDAAETATVVVHLEQLCPSQSAY